MRVRPAPVNRPRTDRRPHVIERPVVEPVPPTHPAERRHRECVAPEDTALYTCGCGCSFQAPVTTSVCCPHCGCGQAW